MDLRKGILTVESDYPVAETRYAYGFAFIPKEPNYRSRNQNFRELVNGQIKAVMILSEIAGKAS